MGLACGIVIAGIGCGIVNKGRKKRRHAGTIIALNISSDVGGRIVELLRTHVPIGDLKIEIPKTKTAVLLGSRNSNKIIKTNENGTNNDSSNAICSPSGAQNHREGVRNNRNLHRGGKG